MSCQELSDSQRWEYLDRSLPLAHRQVVEQHIGGCPHCAARLEEMRQRPLALERQLMIAPPPDFHRRVMARVAREPVPGSLPAQVGWLAPVLAPGRLAVVSAATLTLAVLSAAMVGAMLAVPVVETAAPVVEAPMANSLLLPMRQALLPLRPFFHDWGWFLLGLGMLAAVMMPAVRALAARYSGLLEPPRRQER